MARINNQPFANWDCYTSANNKTVSIDKLITQTVDFCLPTLSTVIFFCKIGRKAPKGKRKRDIERRICKNCPKRNDCIGASTTRRMATRHVWQGDLDVITYLTRKTVIGRRIYEWRKETIVRSFAKDKVNHDLRFARMRGIHKQAEAILPDRCSSKYGLSH